MKEIKHKLILTLLIMVALMTYSKICQLSIKRDMQAELREMLVAAYNTMGSTYRIQPLLPMLKEATALTVQPQQKVSLETIKLYLIKAK